METRARIDFSGVIQVRAGFVQWAVRGRRLLCLEVESTQARDHTRSRVPWGSTKEGSPVAQGLISHRVQIDDPPIAQFLFSDTRLAPLWLILRIYAGYQWIQAGLEKLQSPTWTGATAGSALTGFVASALPKASAAHPDVSGWYASFLTGVVLPHAAVWSWAISLGETLVGVALVLGFFTGIAAFFGGMMNANYLLAGTVSTNPLLFIIATWLVLGWRVAGYWGADHWLLRVLGVPGRPGTLFEPIPIPTRSRRDVAG